jgi:hypothetical protein
MMLIIFVCCLSEMGRESGMDHQVNLNVLPKLSEYPAHCCPRLRLCDVRWVELIELREACKSDVRVPTHKIFHLNSSREGRGKETKEDQKN